MDTAMTPQQDQAVRLMSKGVAALAALEELSECAASYQAAKEAADNTYANSIRVAESLYASNSFRICMRAVDAIERLDADMPEEDDDDDD